MEIKMLLREINKAIRHDIMDGRAEDTPYKIHASSVYDFCPYRVKLALALKRGYSPQQPLDSGRAMTFKIGRKIQDIIIESVVSFQPEYVYGFWRCPICDSRYIGSGVNRKCKRCNVNREYHELEVRYTINDKFFISGSIDLLYGIDKFVPFEIKSVRREDFELKEPIYKYVYQLAVYLWLIKYGDVQRPEINSDFGVLLYIPKFHRNPPLKAFKVPGSITKRIDRDIKELVKGVRDLDNATKICKSSNSPLAKKCPFRRECWEIGIN